MEINYQPVIKPHNTKILIKNGLLAEIGQLLDAKIRRIGLVTDTNVYPLYGKALEQSLIAAGFEVCTTVLAAGEESKTMDSIQALYNDFSQGKLTRSDAVLALGGGVVGDIAGFAAATYLRGVKVYQIPTTLLAQTDSAIGGKTGVDLPSGKNRAGAFYQPEAVFIDPLVLKTLPKEQLACGFAEIIKYACIKDAELFKQLEAGVDEDIERVIYTCCRIKAQIVENDALEAGERMLLNFGHTVGHGIEKYYNYSQYTHGHAVAAGMCALLPMSEELLGLSKTESERIRALCRQYNLPEKIEYDKGKLLEYIGYDKKQAGSHLNLVLLSKIGRAEIVPVKTDMLEKYL